FGILEVESTNHKDKFRTILDGTYNDLLHSTMSHSSYQVTTKKEKEIDRKNFQVMKDYYSSCVDVDMNDGSVFQHFFRDLNRLKKRTMSIDPKTQLQISARTIDTISYSKTTDGLVIDAGGLFTMEIVPDDKNKSQMALAVSPPSEFNNVESAPLDDLDPETLYQIVSSALGYKNSTERDRDRLSHLKRSGLQTISDSDIYSLVDSAISVQKRLYHLTKAWDEPGYYTYSVEEITEAFPFIEWGSILESNIPKGRDYSNITIQLYNSEYFDQLNYYSNINDPTRVLHKTGILNYLIVHKIYQDAPILDSEMRQLVPDSPFQTRSSICVDKVLDNMGLVAGRFYAMITFAGEEDRLKLEEMAEAIKESLGNRIKKSDWLDESTRQAAIKKLGAMKKTIGYSTELPDERSPFGIHDYLNGLDTSANSFYENEKAVTRWALSKYWETFGRKLSSTEWIGVAAPQVVNAFNLLSKNSIVVSAAFAQKPNYDTNYPDYLNYGGIGQTLGHEYSHGFDDIGSQYDEHGVERNWWSDETHAKYTEKAQCFINQYSKAFVRDDDGHKYTIDGSLTLGENIADNEGLSATFDAYMKLKESGKGYNPILPGLQNFSPEALFFINAGRSFCSKPLPGTVKDFISDEHAPDSVRANKVFQNSHEFARVFNCPIGSKMSPKTKKCKIW
ncbi:hypothetical protein CU098_012866, partial [Rhizopus stolonifer]